METNLKWIIAAIIVVLVAGGAAVVNLPSIMAGSSDGAAKSLINNVELAEDTYVLSGGSYATRDQLTSGTDPLVKDKGKWDVSATDGHYCIAARSDSGKTFYSYKGATDVIEGTAPDAATAGVACPTIP